ncbi:flagellar hook-basal body complex protein FliE [Litchfieldia alkalitelluris]|uniref:flagellar hook-basal body complex protein FliE n=1 Tax=Litchfieldia alkalitelluris TaxID=304268 RepID=UPI00099799EF|nr:flagellar hook-basal body complex protein FliE [Litchfieldia alkalitelluris]
MIDRLNVLNKYQLPNQINTMASKSSSDSINQFSTFLKDAINQVNKASNASDLMTNKLASGEKVDLHEVMIAAEKSGVTLLTTIEVRNKVVEAYQEIMRMQV